MQNEEVQGSLLCGNHNFLTVILEHENSLQFPITYAGLRVAFYMHFIYALECFN